MDNQNLFREKNYVKDLAKQSLREWKKRNNMYINMNKRNNRFRTILFCQCSQEVSKTKLIIGPWLQTLCENNKEKEHQMIIFQSHNNTSSIKPHMST